MLRGGLAKGRVSGKKYQNIDGRAVPRIFHDALPGHIRQRQQNMKFTEVLL